ncbi:hypothetical protein BC937DRAFT_90043 [Endogone sp. FLAS-F59071]|nr:hypothetical protein BC937DRAFT_90043 [Endogone sp. FLAS-F59071]|eukprot:RUS22187.1 hypothetical protein BC937DRAFT_90043 [Endogone sp. FLAS-F59071]
MRFLERLSRTTPFNGALPSRASSTSSLARTVCCSHASSGWTSYKNSTAEGRRKSLATWSSTSPNTLAWVQRQEGTCCRIAKSIRR